MANNKPEGELGTMLLKLALLEADEGQRIEFKDPLTKENWTTFIQSWLRASGLKYKVDTDGDVNIRFGNGGVSKSFDKDFAMLFLQAAKLSSKSEDAFIAACLVIGDQKLPEKDRDKVHEYLTRATYGSRVGSFGIMQERMVFKVSMLADNKTDGNDLAQTLFQSRKLFGNYYNYLPNVLEGSLTVVQAIEQAEK